MSKRKDIGSEEPEKKTLTEQKQQSEPKAREKADKPAASAKSAEGQAKKPAKTAKPAKSPKTAVTSAGKSTTKKEPKPAKSSKKSESSEAPTSKTPQVMKLVAPHGDYVNPVIIAGKSSIPKKLRGVEPLSRIMRREASAVLGEDISGLPAEEEEIVTLNLTAAAISENAAVILRRFNACDCEKCVAALTKMTEEKVPARFVRISKHAAESGSGELEEQKEPVKKAVVSQMIRVLLGNKKRSFHEE